MVNTLPWKASSHLPLSLEGKCQLLWNPKVHNHVQTCPYLKPILSQFNPVHSLTAYISKIPFQHYTPVCTYGFQVLSSLHTIHLKLSTHLLFSWQMLHNSYTTASVDQNISYGKYITNLPTKLRKTWNRETVTKNAITEIKCSVRG